MLSPGQLLPWPCLILPSSAPRDWFQTECKTGTIFNDSIIQVWPLNMWFLCFHYISETKKWSQVLFINIFCLSSSQLLSLALLLHWERNSLDPLDPQKTSECLHPVIKASSRAALRVHIKASMNGLFPSLVFDEKRNRCECKEKKFVIKHIVEIKHPPETENLSFLGKLGIQIHSVLCLISHWGTRQDWLNWSTNYFPLFLLWFPFFCFTGRLCKSINQTVECNHLRLFWLLTFFSRKKLMHV